jgi:hypothetical protein
MKKEKVMKNKLMWKKVMKMIKKKVKRNKLNIKKKKQLI